MMQEALRFLESPKLREYLEDLCDDTIKLRSWCKLIASSRASITEKASVLWEVAKKYSGDDLCNPSAMAKDIQKALTLTQGGGSDTIFLLTQYWRGNQDEAPKSMGNWDFVKNYSKPYYTFEQAVQGIAEEYSDDVELVDDEWCWNTITCYVLSPEGRFKEVISFIVSESGVIWGYDWYDERSNSYLFGDFSLYNDINIPTPFQVGDIITVDCRPFSEIYHAVVLDNSDPQDFCFPFCVFSTWSVGSWGA